MCEGDGFASLSNLLRDNDDLAEKLLVLFAGEPFGKNRDLGYLGLNISFDKEGDGALVLRKVPGLLTEEIYISKDARVTRLDIEGFKPLSPKEMKALLSFADTLKKLNDEGKIINRNHACMFEE